MKKEIGFIILLFCVTAVTQVSYAQETRITGTLKTHPWVKLPVVLSTDIKGSMQNLDTLTVGVNPSILLNTTIPVYNRTTGMVATVTDAGSNYQVRFFKYNGANLWTEIYVMQQWEAAHIYAAGQSVAYNNNFYTANTSFTSDATTFINDSAKWNAAGGKDAAYKVSSMVMGVDTITRVAINGDVIDAVSQNHTLATVGYLASQTGSSAFDGTKSITRSGWTGVTGTTPGTTTVIDFLNKVFYPVSSPYVTSFNYNNNVGNGQFSSQSVVAKVISSSTGTISIPYSTWNTASNFNFNYSVVNQSVSDGGNSPIQKVEMYKGATSLGNNAVGNLNPTVTGAFTVPKASFTTNSDIQQTNTVTLRVTDGASNIVNLDLNANFAIAQGATVSNTLISATSGGAKLTGAEGTGVNGDPYLIERTGADLSNFLNWSITQNDDIASVSNIYFTGTGVLPSTITGTNLIQTSAAISFPNADAVTVYNMGVSAKGTIANDVSGVAYSAYYQLQDKLYCGFLSSDVSPADAAIKALQTKSLKTATYYNAAGNTYTNSTGASGFFTWAVPTYVDGSLAAPTFSKTAYYYATGQWFTNTNTKVYYVKVTEGSATSWYWICIYEASVANGGTIQVKLS